MGSDGQRGAGAMRYPVELILRGIRHSGALEKYVTDQARELNRTGASILACRVVAEALNRDERQRQRFSVQITVTLPGTEVAVNRERDGDLYLALSDAFKAVSLQTGDHPRPG